jgi:hypothetical protein
MTTGASPLESITISWQEDGIQILNFSDCPTPSSVNTSSSTYVSTLQNDFSSEANWNANASCTAGVLQVDMAPSAGWSTVGQLQQASYSVFLAPATNSVDTTPQPVVNAEIYPSVCGSGSGGIYACTVTLTLPPPNNQTGYYLRVTPIYSDADVSITATSTTGQQVTLTGGQVEIDSTGKAGDNLKRIQERISANPVSNSDAPVPALQGLNGICKEFYTRPGVSTNAPGVNC